jgi:hypothetical protein
MSPKLISSLLLQILGLTLISSNCFAQDRTVPIGSAPLSQLEFDQPVHGTVETEPVIAVPKNAPLVDPEEVARRLLSEAENPHPAATGLAPAVKSAAARAKLSVASANRFVVPRLKGPEADSTDVTQITSRISWKRKAGASCKDPADAANLCKKAGALDELLSRFSGNNDFSTTQCQTQCPLGTVSRLVSLKFADLRGGSFRLVSNDDECRYQFGRKSDGQWLMLEATATTCECLPTSCG